MYLKFATIFTSWHRQCAVLFAFKDSAAIYTWPAHGSMSYSWESDILFKRCFHVWFWCLLSKLVIVPLMTYFFIRSSIEQILIPVKNNISGTCSTFFLFIDLVLIYVLRHKYVYRISLQYFNFVFRHTFLLKHTTDYCRGLLKIFLFYKILILIRGSIAILKTTHLFYNLNISFLRTSLLMKRKN